MEVSRIPKERRAKRKAIRSKKDVGFKRYLSWEFWRFERRESWRKPKGNDNKMRLEIKGYTPRVKIGYRNRADIRGLHPSGLKPVIVSNAKEFDGLNPREHIIYIASTVGLRKRLELVKLALEKGFKVVG